jgi:energy-coupling factor transporter ATP-binding protein EcfA2
LNKIHELSTNSLDLSFNALTLGQKPPDYDSRCPFPGLYAFEEKDREFFFGRENLTKDLADKLNRVKFLPILGTSGTGKSSLAKAGIIPYMEEREEGIDAVIMTPADDPLSALDKLIPADPKASQILLVDQFEEVFTHCKRNEIRIAFFDRLLALSKQMRVIITMRADFWGDCAPYEQLKQTMLTNQELITPMNAHELQIVMEKQAAVVGLRLQEELKYTILNSIEQEPGAMPLLQHLLKEMWNRRHGRWLPTSEYINLGGIQEAISVTADKIYKKLGEEEQRLMRNIFLRLSSPDEENLHEDGYRFSRRRQQRLNHWSSGIW